MKLLEWLGDLHFFFLEMQIWTRSFFQESHLSFPRTLEQEREGVRKKMEKRLKITSFFARRYLGNGKSYRDKWKTVLKSKIPRFYRSLVDREPLFSKL